MRRDTLRENENYERILSRRVNSEGEEVILVEKAEPFGDISGFSKEWITWIVDNSGNRFWGHYFYDKEEAQEDFARRSL